MINQLEIFQNNTISIPVEVTEDIEVDGEVVEQAKDLTGYEAYISLKKNKKDDDDSAVVYKTWTSHTDPTSGVTSIDLDMDDTAEVGTFDFEFGLIDGSGGVTTILIDKLTIKPVVHREH